MLQRTNASLRLSTQRIICLFGGMTLLFLATMLSSFAAPDISMLLQHAETELKNPLTFSNGIADLYIILQESSYKDDPALEHKLISLIKQAQRSPLAHQQGHASAVAELSHQAVSEYANSRYGLELSIVKQQSGEKSHSQGSTGAMVTYERDSSSETTGETQAVHGTKHKHSIISETPLYTGTAAPRRRRATTPRKKAATPRKAAAPRKKKIASASPRTVKEKAQVNSKPSIGADASGAPETTKPPRKSRARAKKTDVAPTPQQQISQKDSTPTTPVKKPHARKKAAP